MKVITIDELKKEIEATGYYPTEELLYDTFNALSIFQEDDLHPGQDVFALCLEGPPGAGKTAFAKMYRNLVSNHFGYPVELVEYQCDPATSEEKLKEDIRIVAVVTRDGKEVIIPGILVKTVQMLNEGKKVILFIDEYDKAREETDSFFLQFLQDGKLNAVQSGDMEIKPEYKNNLQVIFCKNDAREELSGPLTRRLRVIRLDYMEPTLFHTVAKRVLIDEKEPSKRIEESLLNLVTLLYQYAYEINDSVSFNRLPACSEMLIALEDANRLMTLANAPKSIIYKTIIKNMFKNKDDLSSFEESLKKSRDKDTKQLASLVADMQKDQNMVSYDQQKEDLLNLMAKTVLQEAAKQYIAKQKQLEDLISGYETRFSSLYQRYQDQLNAELEQIKLENGRLLSDTRLPKASANFPMEAINLRRGQNIFQSSTREWMEVATIEAGTLSHSLLVDQLIDNGEELILYENGVLLLDYDDFKLIAFREEENPTYHVMSDSKIVPSTFLYSTYSFIDFLSKTMDLQAKLQDKKPNSITGSYEINTLIYNDQDLPLDKVEGLDHVYHFYTRGSLKDKSTMSQEIKTVSNMKCDDLLTVLNVSNNLQPETKKVYQK